MERSEYPSIVASVPPSAAVNILRERVRRAQSVNSEISEWLQERRRVEDAYIIGLQKLIKRPTPNDASELGVFHGPWQRIVNATASLASAHQVFSQKLEAEVERPIHEFAVANQEWSGLKTMEGNLAHMAKSIDTAEEKSEKLKKKGKKADAGKVAEAASAVQGAVGEWESQAPFIFEKLQACDEARITHLRESLTRMQTLEIDQANQILQIMETTVQALLDVNVQDEIRQFAHRCTGPPGSAGAGLGGASARGNKMHRLTHRPGTGGGSGAPSIITDDTGSFQSSHSGEKGHSGLGSSLRRLGTVMKGRSNRNSTILPYSSPITADKASSDRLGIGRAAHGGASPSTSASHLPQASLAVPSEENVGKQRKSSSEDAPISPMAGGSASPVATSKPQLLLPADGPTEEPTKDSEGFTIPPSKKDLDDPISEAEAQEAGADQGPQFRLEIKNEIIPEEEEEADAAMSKVANTLRLNQPTPANTAKRVRGRRDNRYTIYETAETIPDVNMFGNEAEGSGSNGNLAPVAVTPPSAPSPAAPSPVIPSPPEPSHAESNQAEPSYAEPNYTEPSYIEPSGAAVSTTMSGSAPSPPMSNATPVAMPPPPPPPSAPQEPQAMKIDANAQAPSTAAGLNMASPALPLAMMRQTTLASDAGSDTQSVRSAHSSTYGSQAIKHPELHDPGLSASIIEVVNVTFEGGIPKKASSMGEIAFSYNPTDPNTPLGQDLVRITCAHLMEKVAPNPAYIQALPQQPGEYKLSLATPHRTALAFRYQLHTDDLSSQSCPPVIVTPAWRVEPHQASLILTYKPNPLFARNRFGGQEQPHIVTLRNLIFVVGVEGVQATSVQSKPVGAFSKERSKIVWKVSELQTSDEAGGKLIARFATEGPAKPGAVDVRWEIMGESDVRAAGSGVGVEMLHPAKEVEKDPFADDVDDTPEPQTEWKEVKAIKKIMSGKYLAA